MDRGIDLGGDEGGDVYVPEAAGPFLGEVEDGGAGACGEEGGGGGVLVDLQAVPVVQACAAEVAFVQGEAQWVHEVECGSGGAAGAADVAGVLGDFWLEEDYVDFHAFEDTMFGREGEHVGVRRMWGLRVGIAGIWGLGDVGEVGGMGPSGAFGHVKVLKGSALCIRI